jgi:CspA family cold shock protein
MARVREGMMLTGVVKNVVQDKGFGFILVDGGSEEFFFHFTACKGVRFDQLEKGTRVQFEAGSGSKGPRAENVELTK